jgi:hypothetical protein
MADTLLKYSVEEKRELVESLLKHLQQQREKKAKGKDTGKLKLHRSSKFYFTGMISCQLQLFLRSHRQACKRWTLSS